MKIKEIFTVISIEINDGEFIKFGKTTSEKMDCVSLIRGVEPDPLDEFTEEEIRIAEGIAKDEFKRRNL